jgi:hypothetical protein
MANTQNNNDIIATCCQKLDCQIVCDMASLLASLSKGFPGVTSTCFHSLQITLRGLMAYWSSGGRISETTFEDVLNQLEMEPYNVSQTQHKCLVTFLPRQHSGRASIAPASYQAVVELACKLSLRLASMLLLISCSMLPTCPLTG